jgi:hypothetical protein
MYSNAFANSGWTEKYFEAFCNVSMIIKQASLNPSEGGTLEPYCRK